MLALRQTDDLSSKATTYFNNTNLDGAAQPGDSRVYLGGLKSQMKTNYLTCIFTGNTMTVFLQYLQLCMQIYIQYGSMITA